MGGSLHRTIGWERVGGGSDERRERGGSEKSTEDPSETARHVLEPNVRMLKVPWGHGGHKAKEPLEFNIVCEGPPKHHHENPATMIMSIPWMIRISKLVQRLYRAYASHTLRSGIELCMCTCTGAGEYLSYVMVFETCVDSIL